jgi:Fe-S-cluster containining protein
VDELTVFAVEAERIRRTFGEILAGGRPHEVGACALLDGDGGCRVYPARPYVCRTQGLPLRFFEELRAGGVTVERRDICPLNAEGPAVEALRESECWTIGPYEARLREIQGRWSAGRLERVPLRSLFADRAGAGSQAGVNPGKVSPCSGRQSQ